MTDEEALKVWRDAQNVYARVIQAAFAEREAAKDAEIAALRADVAELVKEKAAYDKAINLAHKVGYLQGKVDSGKTTTLPGGLLETVGTEPPPGCHCGEVCMAPKIMGRQMPCRRRPEILAKHGASKS